MILNRDLVEIDTPSSKVAADPGRISTRRDPLGIPRSDSISSSRWIAVGIEDHEVAHGLGIGARIDLRPYVEIAEVLHPREDPDDPGEFGIRGDIHSAGMKPVAMQIDRIHQQWEEKVDPMPRPDE